MRGPTGRLVFRLLAEAILLVPVVLLYREWVAGREAGEFNAESNLQMSAVVAGIGILGWWLPRVAAAILLVLAAGLGLAALAYSGSVWAGVGFAALPAAAAACFLLSRRLPQARA